MQEMQEIRVQFLGWEDPLDEEMATHSSYSCLGNPMDSGACQAVVHGITKSQTPLRIQAGTFYLVAVGTDIEYHLITQSVLLVSPRQVFRTTRQFRPFSLNSLLNLILYYSTVYF